MDRRGETLQEAAAASRATGRDAIPAYDVRVADVDGNVGAFNKASAWDPNVADEKTVVDLEKEELKSEQDADENSPYPEVQAAVANTDDMSVPANTLRAWILGMFFVTVMSGLNVFFSLRQPNITIGPLVVQLCAYPAGKLMEFALPRRVFNLFGLKFSLNPGRFNKKEHALITIMANVAYSNGYGSFLVQNFGPFG
jgi:OPT oligopeptide transporter protein